MKNLSLIIGITSFLATIALIAAIIITNSVLISISCIFGSVLTLLLTVACILEYNYYSASSQSIPYHLFKGGYKVDTSRYVINSIVYGTLWIIIVSYLLSVLYRYYKEIAFSTINSIN